MAFLANKKTFIGTVLSNKMTKTIVVDVETKSLHPLYRKLIVRNKKYHVHDEKNTANVGDFVQFKETRPLSATKKYILTKIIKTKGEKK
ncbi:MAG: 30S ribosomal protein S17 [Mycoplasmataceae bacterium]|jgi:small subunit ribosomal protein S17|nr:30S ribosomal protein S17 [Mycoplasmataceae bacterium]